MKSTKTWVLITLFYFLLGIIQAEIVQWTVDEGGNGHYYQAVLELGITWDEANAAAQARGNGWHLATITSYFENQFVINLFNANPAFQSNALVAPQIGPISNGPWIGGFSSSKTSNDWQWVTGEPFMYSAWGGNEPWGNGEKLGYSFFGESQTVGWNDIPNAYPAAPPTGYILENIVPEPTTFSLLTLGGLLLKRRNRRT